MCRECQSRGADSSCVESTAPLKDGAAEGIPPEGWTETEAANLNFLGGTWRHQPVPKIRYDIQIVITPEGLT